VDAVFTFETEDGVVKVYILRSEIAKFAVATFETANEKAAYGVHLLNTPSLFDALSLIEKAAKEWPQEKEDNPFNKLMSNREAIEKLYRALRGEKSEHSR